MLVLVAIVLLLALPLAAYAATVGTVTYEGNGQTSGTPPVDPHVYAMGETVTVLDQGTLLKTGFSFEGWQIVTKTVKGYVSPMAVDDHGFGEEFLDLFDIHVELRPAFLTPASPSLSTVAVLYDSSGVGMFTFEDVVPGTYVLHIYRAGYLVRSMNITVLESDPDEIFLAPPPPAPSSGIPDENGIFNLWPGDCNQDFRIDNSDVLMIMELYIINAQYPDALYNPACDLNADGLINVDDISLVVSPGFWWNTWILDYPGAEDVEYWEGDPFAVTPDFPESAEGILKPGDTFDMFSTHVILRAVWKVIDYTITYEGLAGSSFDPIDPNPISYNVTDTFPIPITDPTKVGFTFLGWTVAYADPALTDITTPTTPYSIPAGTLGNIVLTAHWKANAGTPDAPTIPPTGDSTALWTASYLALFGISLVGTGLIKKRR